MLSIDRKFIGFLRYKVAERRKAFNDEALFLKEFNKKECKAIKKGPVEELTNTGDKRSFGD